MRRLAPLLLLLLMPLSSAYYYPSTGDIVGYLTDDFVGPSLMFICSLWCVVIMITGPIASFVLVYGGVWWLSSQDDPARRKEAHQVIKNVIIGTLIIILAEATVYIIIEQSISCECF